MTKPTYIYDWIHDIVTGVGGFFDYEKYEWPIYNCTREEFIAAFVIRCLANPNCEGSNEILQEIVERRMKQP